MTEASTLTQLRRKSLDSVSDAWPWLARRRLQRMAELAQTSAEPGLRLTRAAVSALGTELFVDVGANEGIYSWTAHRSGSEVIAFEPNPRLADRLRLAIPSAAVVGAAVSDGAGLARLAIPVFDREPVASRGSIAPSLYSGMRTSETTVPRITLDSALDDLTGSFLLKIDVEGHELEALRGGESTITERCNMAIVESEERHRNGAPQQVIDWFTTRGFSAWILRSHRLEPATSFDPRIHQAISDRRELDEGNHPSGNYVNNFVFWRDSEAQALRAAASAAALPVQTDHRGGQTGSPNQ